MSYDFEIRTKNGSALYGSDMNLTSNLKDILSESMKVYIGDCSGVSCSILASKFEDAIIDIVKNPAKYQEMEPRNGWGTINDALEMLHFYLNWCEREPEMFFHVDY